MWGSPFVRRTESGEGPAYSFLLRANPHHDADIWAGSAEDGLVDMVDRGIVEVQQGIFDPPIAVRVIRQTLRGDVEEPRELHLLPLFDSQAREVEVGRDVRDQENHGSEKDDPPTPGRFAP